MHYDCHDVTIRFNHSDPTDNAAYVFVCGAELPADHDTKVFIANTWGFVVFAGEILEVRRDQGVVLVRPAIADSQPEMAAS